ncbi:hypothetical protein BpHYR1_011776 [Brachionus plicatilis]
MKYFF